MSTWRESDLGVGGVGINEDNAVYEGAEVSRLSDADALFAHTDYATNHEFITEALLAVTQDNTMQDSTINEWIEEPSELPVPAAASFSRNAKLDGGRKAKLRVAAVTVLMAACVLVVLKLLTSSRLSIADQGQHKKGEKLLPDVPHDEAAAKAEQDRIAALNQLENLLQLLEKKMGPT
ncbi:hypothetical protein Emed_003806 [Eimeria media]